MNKKVKNKLAMYKNVQIVINANAASWNGLPAFVSAFDTYSGKLALLEDYGFEQSKIIKGVKVAKEEQLNETIAKATQVRGAVLAYATSIGDKALQEKLKLRKSAMKYASRVNCIHIIDGILALANEHVAELAPFGILPADVAECQSLRDGLNASFLTPRQAILERKLLTSNIDAVDGELEDLLRNSIDQLVEVLKFTDKVFYQKYTNARDVLAYGVHHNPALNGEGNESQGGHDPEVPHSGADPGGGDPGGSEPGV